MPDLPRKRNCLSTLCLHCKSGKRKRLGKSRVLASRTVASHASFKGKIIRTWTMERYRECLSCKWRWKTIEYMRAAKTGRPKFGSAK